MVKKGDKEVAKLKNDAAKQRVAWDKSVKKQDTNGANAIALKELNNLYGKLQKEFNQNKEQLALCQGKGGAIVDIRTKYR